MSYTHINGVSRDGPARPKTRPPGAGALPRAPTPPGESPAFAPGSKEARGSGYSDRRAANCHMAARPTDLPGCAPLTPHSPPSKSGRLRAYWVQAALPRPFGRPRACPGPAGPRHPVGAPSVHIQTSCISSIHVALRGISQHIGEYRVPIERPRGPGPPIGAPGRGSGLFCGRGPSGVSSR